MNRIEAERNAREQLTQHLQNTLPGAPWLRPSSSNIRVERDGDAYVATVRYGAYSNVPAASGESIRYEPDDKMLERDVGDGLTESEATEILEDAELRVSGEELTQNDLETYASKGVQNDRVFTSRQHNRVSATFYQQDGEQLTRPVEGVPTIEFSGGEGVEPITRFLDAVRTVGADQINPDAIGRDGALIEAAEERETRRDLRDSLDSTLEAEGYDPDRWNTDARADGTLILQDPETNKTKTIEPDSDESGIDSAVESLDSSSDSSTSDSDSTSDGTSSSPGGGSDGLGQVGGIMLVAAIATAVYYGVTQL